MKTQMMKFLRDEDGLTMVEYAVAGGLITLGCVAAFTGLGDAVRVQINKIIAVLGGTQVAAGV